MNVAVGDVLQGELAGDEVQDEAEIFGSFAIESDDRGKHSAVVPVLAEFRVNWSSLDWRVAVK